MEKKKIDIEMADMVGKTYFKIATWFNKDFESDKERQDALKHTAAEIIQQVLEDTFLQMDGVVNTESKTVSQGTPKTTINQTEGGTGKLFTPTDSAILEALRQENQ
jgi:hypothetical protein